MAMPRPRQWLIVDVRSRDRRDGSDDAA
jgi:hypothetical protein